MADQVLLHPRLEKQLDAMRAKTNAPSIAAHRAQKIIDAMIQGASSRAAGLFRARSDARVKGSWKYDLGAGYRLICIRTQDVIYVMHAGDHESCDAWLNSNSKKQPHNTEIKMTAFTIRNKSEFCVFQNQTSRGAMSDNLAPDFDEHSLEPIAQEYLRKIFCGLVAG